LKDEYIKRNELEAEDYQFRKHIQKTLRYVNFGMAVGEALKE
jgi:hypothetical protein